MSKAGRPNPDAFDMVHGFVTASLQGELREGEDEDFAQLPAAASREIEVASFVPADQIDPMYFDKTYYLAPSSAEAARRPYVLLLRAMQESGMAAVGKFVLWGKENLCLIRAQGDALAMETLFFADDIRSKAEIEEAVESVELKKPELELAGQVIQSLVGEWKPEDFENEYRRDLKAMLDAKLAGETPMRPEPPAETPVVDLMEALRRSVAEVQDRKGAGAAKAKTAPKKPKATPSEGGSRARPASARK